MHYMVSKCDDTKLIEQSIKYFAQYKDVNTFYVTSDSQFFFNASQSAHHVRNNDVILYKINRADLPKAKESKPYKSKSNGKD